MNIAADDYVLIGGSSGIERSRAESRKGWAEEFATKGHDRYVRTTTQIEVDASKGVLRTAELGRWEGINRKAAGMSRPFGRYGSQVNIKPSLNERPLSGSDKTNV